MHTPHRPPAERPLANLQGLRFAAALAVVLYHVAPHHEAMAGATALFPAVARWGFLGVDVFFVLSGFIIAISTRRIDDTAGVARFALRRASRIYLAWWPVFLVAAALLWLGGDGRREIDFTRSFLLVPMSLEHSLVPVTWTLTFELAFYGFVAAALLIGRAFCLPLLLAYCGVVLVANVHFVASGLYTPSGLASAGVVEKFLLSPFWLEFAAGFALAVGMDRWRLPARVTALLALAVPVVTATGAGAGWLPPPEQLVGFYETPARITIGLILATTLVATAVVTERQVRLVMPQWLSRLGDSTYSLYLTHTLELHWGLAQAIGPLDAAPCPPPWWYWPPRVSACSPAS